MTKRKDPMERKEPFRLKIKRGLIERIKRIPLYNPKIERLIEENIEKLEKED